MNALFNFPPSILCFLGGVIITVITASLFAPISSKHESSTHYWISRFALFALLAASLWIIGIYPQNEKIFLSGHFIWSPLTALLSISLTGLSLPVFIYTQDALHQGGTASEDYYILVLLSLFGGLAMLTAGSILSLYLGLEIMSLSTYGMVGLESKEGLRIEATMKYIVMGMLSSALLLYGLCLLYFINPSLSLSTFPTLMTSGPTLMSQIGASLLFAGLLFKLGAAPFHFWVPDVYQGASLSTTLFIATIPKFAAIGMGLRLFLDRLSCLTENTQFLLLSIGLLSIIGGNLMTLVQVNIKRLLAYSSIAHMGFIVIGFALPWTQYAIVLFYGINYCFMAGLLFGVLAHLSRLGLEVNTVYDLKGLSAQYPMAALLILIAMSAMAGIPPSIGFFSKFGLLYSLLKQEFYIVASIALVGTVIGAYYYLRIIKSMYFDLPNEPSHSLSINSFSISKITLGCSGLILIGLSISPGTLISAIGKNIYFHSLPIESTQQTSHITQPRASSCD